MLDRMIPYIYEELQLSIIADPLHHTSYPRWLRQGFFDPEFSRLYLEFVTAFAYRYPCVTAYTPFNEPTCTLDFSGFRGFWHPYHNSEGIYVAMLRHTAGVFLVWGEFLAWRGAICRGRARTMSI